MIAEQDELNKLSEKKSAQLLVISDSHGHKENLYDALIQKGKECDALIFLGDGIEDLLNLIEENHNLEQKDKFLPSVIVFVQGNGDDSYYSYYTDEIKKIDIPETQEITAAGKRIFITHGHRFNVYYTLHRLEEKLETEDYDIVLFGHTHVPFQERLGSKLLLNPGSISLPRNHSNKCFVVLTVEKFSPQIKYEFFTVN